MKKYLLTISAILMLLVTGCEMFPPDDSQTQPITVEKPEISGVSADDTSMTATITPVAGTGFYSYAVIAGPRQTLDPSTLLGLGYSNAVISGIANYAEQQSLTISTDGLSRNVMYYIYAVAASEQGVPSEIEVDSVYTSNSLTPNITGSFSIDTVGVVFAVPFTENVELSGNGNVYVSYYKVNDLADSVNTKKQVVPADSLSVEGNVLYVAVPDKTPGLYITLSWDAGILVNSAGTPNPAWTNDAYGKQNLKMRAGRKAWNLGYELVLDADGDTTYFAGDETFLFSDWTTFTAVFTPEKEIAYDNGTVRVTYTSGNGDVLSYDNQYFTLNADGNVVVALDRAPSYGDVISFAFPAGLFQDVYGNPNAAFTTEPIYNYAFDYKVEDIEGVYEGIGLSYFDNNAYYLNFDDPMNVNIEIEVVEDVDLGEDFDNFKANVVVKNLMFTGSEVYGYFDTTAGTISFPIGQYIASNADGSQNYYFTSDHSPVIWNMPSKGSVVSQDLWGYHVYDAAGNALGYDDAFSVTQLTLLQEGAQTAKTSAAPVRKHDLTISELHTL